MTSLAQDRQKQCFILCFLFLYLLGEIYYPLGQLQSLKWGISPKAPNLSSVLTACKNSIVDYQFVPSVTHEPLEHITGASCFFSMLNTKKLTAFSSLM